VKYLDCKGCKPAISLVVLSSLLTSAVPISSVAAADLGADCCADLEQRIAELEATTARKGNHKLSLTISGFVHQSLMYWDDGDEQNIYQVTNDTSRTRVRFRGRAEFTKDWSAGYRLEIGIRTARSDRVDQNNDDQSSIDLRYSSWFIKSKTFGTVHVGMTESASQGITEIHLAGSKYASKNSDPEDYMAGFQLRARNARGQGGLSALEWRRLLKDNGVQPGEGARGNHVYYVSPTLAGFHVMAAWGEDDNWDIGVRYKGTLGDFKVAAGIAYGEATEAGAPICAPLFVDGIDKAKCSQIGGSASVMHNPTGLFVSFGAGRYQDERAHLDAAFIGENPDDVHTFYAGMAGVEQNWNSLGKTTIWGEYFHYDGGANDRSVGGTDALNPFAGTARIWDSGVQIIGAGISQKIDTAAMAIYVSYRHMEGDLRLRDDATGTIASVPLEDLDVVMTGALIQF